MDALWPADIRPKAVGTPGRRQRCVTIATRRPPHMRAVLNEAEIVAYIQVLAV